MGVYYPIHVLYSTVGTVQYAVTGGVPYHRWIGQWLHFTAPVPDCSNAASQHPIPLHCGGAEDSSYEYGVFELIWWRDASSYGDSSQTLAIPRSSEALLPCS